MNHLSPEMQRCIDHCLDCYRTCLSMLSQHCLEAGGAHTEPNHLRLMMACAEICRSSAHFMLLGTPLHRETCRACAAVCRECAESCEAIEGMEECAAACRRCAESCAAMAA